MYLICFTTLNALNALHNNSNKRYNLTHKYNTKNMQFIHTHTNIQRYFKCLYVCNIKGHLVNVTYLKSAQVQPTTTTIQPTSL